MPTFVRVSVSGAANQPAYARLTTARTRGSTCGHSRGVRGPVYTRGDVLAAKASRAPWQCQEERACRRGWACAVSPVGPCVRGRARASPLLNVPALPRRIPQERRAALHTFVNELLRSGKYAKSTLVMDFFAGTSQTTDHAPGQADAIRTIVPGACVRAAAPLRGAVKHVARCPAWGVACSCHHPVPYACSGIQPVPPLRASPHSPHSHPVTPAPCPPHPLALPARCPVPTNVQHQRATRQAPPCARLGLAGPSLATRRRRGTSSATRSSPTLPMAAKR